VGRATRVVAPAQRTALTVRDGGLDFPPEAGHLP
jgi:hypothetical protein